MAQKTNRFSVVFFSISKLFILILILKSTSTLASLNFCSNDTMFANNSNYQTNLNTLFHYLSSNATNPSGYHQAVSRTRNTTNDTVYGHFLCRGDVDASSCQNCVSTATTTDLPKTYCPNQKDAIIWYEECMVRYSYVSFFGQLNDDEGWIYLSPYNISGNSTRFVELMNNMFSNDIGVRAATGGSQKKFATNYVNDSSIETIYGLGQCTPDLSSNDCYTCLVESVKELGEAQGGYVLHPSCVVRYNVFPFFDLSTVPSTSLPPTPTPTPTPLPLSPVANVTIFNPAALPPRHQEENDESRSLVPLLYRFETIREATNNFSDANKLGQGGFGFVYKGILNGQEIAVKRLSKDSTQGDGEFKTEALLVAKLQHRNLVKLLGFCLEKQERIIIYEFVPNTSLDNFLFDKSKRTNLDWETRYRIMFGIARGILYLHEESRLRIIHRDLKASNILLDAEMNPKIADFGTARLFGLDQTQGDTSKIVGTYGYMAPEYGLHGLFSTKSDVFSFGILVLEIITGRKSRNSNNGDNEEDLISFVWRNWKEKKALNIVDPTIKRVSKTKIARCIHIGLLCVQENAQDRPTMSSVVLMLSSHSFTLSLPSYPAYVTHTAASILAPHYFDRNIDKPVHLKIASVNEDSITDLYPR